MDFWKNTLPLMDKKGIKQADLVRKTGKTNAAVYDWVRKGVLPRVDDAVKIAELLGVSVSFLVTGEQEYVLSPLEKKLLEECKNLTEPELNKVIKEAKDLRIMREQEKKLISGSSVSVAK